jgi:hypothetical protein
VERLRVLFFLHLSAENKIKKLAFFLIFLVVALTTHIDATEKTKRNSHVLALRQVQSMFAREESGILSHTWSRSAVLGCWFCDGDAGEGDVAVGVGALDGCCSRLVSSSSSILAPLPERLEGAVAPQVFLCSGQ